MTLPSPADYSEAEKHASDLLAQSAIIGQMCPMIAKARACLAYSGDRAKRALALAIRDARMAGTHDGKPASYASLEAAALASESYRDAIHDLQQQDEQAERAVAEWQAAQAKFDALRTVVALERQKAAL